MMTEPFPIMIDVDEMQLGSVLRKLDTMPGVMTIHLRMNKNGSPALPHNPPPALARALQRQIGTSAKMVPVRNKVAGIRLKTAAATGLGHGAVHYKILKNFLVRTGFSENSVTGVLARMIDEGHVKRVGPGTYRLTARGANKYLQREPVPSQAKKGLLPNNTQGLRNVILSRLKQGKASHGEVKEHIVNEGYVSNNMYILVPKMIEEGLVRRVDGEFEITEQGLNAMNQTTSASTIEAHANEPMHHGEHS